MATVQGTRLTLSDTVGLAIDMSPVIQLIDPFDVGALTYIGMSTLDKPAVATKHEWMEDTLRPLTDVLNEALDASETDVTTTDGTIFRAYDLIKIEDELMLVTSIATNDLTVIRGYAGSTAATHSTALTIEIVSSAVLEGSGAGAARSTVKTSKSNYTQIFEDVVQVSSTLEAVEQWNPGSEYARQLAKTMKVFMIGLDKALIYGKAYAGTAANPRTLGGLIHYITTNVTSAAGAQLSEKLFQDSLNLTYDAGGNVSCALMVLRQKQAMNLFMAANRRTDMGNRRAGAIVDTYFWDHGDVDTVIDRWFPNNRVMFLTKEYLGFGPLAGETPKHEILPKTSRLFQKGQVTAEMTAEVKSEKAHAQLTTLATVIV